MYVWQGFVAKNPEWSPIWKLETPAATFTQLTLSPVNLAISCFFFYFLQVVCWELNVCVCGKVLLLKIQGGHPPGSQEHRPIRTLRSFPQQNVTPFSQCSNSVYLLYHTNNWLFDLILQILMYRILSFIQLKQFVVFNSLLYKILHLYNKCNIFNPHL